MIHLCVSGRLLLDTALLSVLDVSVQLLCGGGGEALGGAEDVFSSHFPRLRLSDHSQSQEVCARSAPVFFFHYQTEWIWAAAWITSPHLALVRFPGGSGGFSFSFCGGCGE